MNDLLDLNLNAEGYVLTLGHYALALGMLYESQGKEDELDVETMFRTLSKDVDSCGGMVNLTRLEELLQDQPPSPDPDAELDPKNLLRLWLPDVKDRAWAPHLIFGKPVLVTDELGGSFAYGGAAVASHP